MSFFRYLSAVAAFVSVASSGCLPSSLFADIVITSATTYAQVVDRDPLRVHEDFSYALAGASTLAQLPGFSSSHNTSYGQSGFSHTINQVRQGGLYDYATSEAYVEFTAQNNDAYAISGSYTNSDGSARVVAFLYDITADVYPYVYDEIYFGQAIFSLTTANGPLIAGHDYQWVFYTNTTNESVDFGAAAFGTASFQIGAVPEPSLAFLGLTAGVAGLRVRRRRDR